MESDVVEMHGFTPLRLGHDGGEDKNQEQQQEQQQETKMGTAPPPMSN